MKNVQTTSDLVAYRKALLVNGEEVYVQGKFSQTPFGLDGLKSVSPLRVIVDRFLSPDESDFGVLTHDVYYLCEEGICFGVLSYGDDVKHFKGTWERDNTEVIVTNGGLHAELMFKGRTIAKNNIDDLFISDYGGCNPTAHGRLNAVLESFGINYRIYAIEGKSHIGNGTVSIPLNYHLSKVSFKVSTLDELTSRCI